MASNTLEELERFRQEWKREVTRKAGAAAASPTNADRSTKRSQEGSNEPSQQVSRPTIPPYASRSSFSAIVTSPSLTGDRESQDHTVQSTVPSNVGPSSAREPSSALDYYESAVEREGEGQLGDSLTHYRKAFRLDANVDRLYKAKHFPPTETKPPVEETSLKDSVAKAPARETTSSHGPPSIIDTILTYESIHISGDDASTLTSHQSACPIASIPSELLVVILFQTAMIDPASFARLASVCKRFAYLFYTEDQIWKDVCNKSDYGFQFMHREWAVEVDGKPLPMSIEDLDYRLAAAHLQPAPITRSLCKEYTNYRQMFHARPRIRFNGCYISTVNYIRPGAANTSQVTFTSPVHIVTYYRYLRFYRDGTCVTLLTTSQPSEVVHHLTQSNTHASHSGGLPSAVMNRALRGRWKLGNGSSSGDPNQVDDRSSSEDTIHIETQGADVGKANAKYTYVILLQLKHANKAPSAARNTKLTWLGYWSYNMLTDDWAQFGLKNDRAFFWSRVKSYGRGE